jgi:uncharacterized membrane protein
MSTSNYGLRRQAREHLSGKWGLAIGAYFLLGLIVSAASSVPIANLFISAAVSLGLIMFSLNLLAGEGEFEDGFKGFSDILRATGATFMVGLFTFLWSLLFIIPGIIKAYSYGLTLYIIAEDPEIRVMDAITKSREMMNGYKMKRFLLDLSFIGWGILCIFTLFIGLLWLIPYIGVTSAAFYNDIRPNVTVITE